MRTLYTTILPIIFLLIGNIGTAQDNSIPERKEKLVANKVSARFDLVAVHRYRATDYKKDDNLVIRFYNMDEGKVKIRAQKTRRRGGNYQMDIGEKLWPKGWQEYNNWPVNSFLHPNRIKLTTVGVKVNNDQNILFPSSIYVEGTQPDLNAPYRFYFNTPRTIKTMKYTVKDTNGKEVYSNSTEDEDAQSIFSIKVPLDESHPEGVYEVKVDITWINNKKYTNSFSFYHQPNVN